MTDYIDLLQGAQDAVFAALKPIELDAGLPDGLGVYQHVPENTQPPIVMIGQIGSESQDEHGDQVELITLELQYVFRGPSRAPLLAMMHAGRRALDNQDIAAAGIAFERPRYQRQEAGDALADGVTYVGIQYFEFTAEPA